MGRIILPELHKPIVNIGVGMSGKYRLEKRNAESGVVTGDTGWFDNLITDSGLGAYILAASNGFGSSSMMNWCSVGTGNSTPNFANTALDNQIATAYAVTTGSGVFPAGPSASGYVAAAGGDPAYWYYRFMYTFDVGAAAGNLTEIAVQSYTNTLPAGILFSRALIVDASGNPTAITVLSNEILTVTYEIRWALDTGDNPFSFNLNGSPITGTYRGYQLTSVPGNMQTRVQDMSAGMNFYSGDIGPYTGQPATQIGQVNVNRNPMTKVQIVNDIANSGTCFIDWTTTLDTTNALGLIKSFSFNTTMWQYQFGLLSTPINKTAGQQMQVNMRTSWGRL